MDSANTASKTARRAGNKYTSIAWPAALAAISGGESTGAGRRTRNPGIPASDRRVSSTAMLSSARARVAVNGSISVAWIEMLVCSFHNNTGSAA
jgi:hypothetical protein